jgi:hypothetical protein
VPKIIWVSLTKVFNIITNIFGGEMNKTKELNDLVGEILVFSNERQREYFACFISLVQDYLGKLNDAFYYDSFTTNKINEFKIKLNEILEMHDKGF